MDGESDVPQRPRGRPRQTGVGRRIREAAAQELIETGVAAFSITKVARRAGVAKGTVSLRYPDPLDLMVDTISERYAWEPVEDLGNLAEELRVLAKRLVDAAMHHPVFALGQSILVASTERPEVWQRYADRIVGTGLTRCRQVLERGVARGEVRPDVDLDVAVCAFVGGLQMITEADTEMRPPTTAKQESLVRLTLAMCAPSVRPTGPGSRAAASRGTRATPPARPRRRSPT
jgi:AcrR family transcriptional regulator